MILFLPYAQCISEDIIGLQIFIESKSKCILGERILSFITWLYVEKKSAVFDRLVFIEDSDNFQLWKDWQCLNKLAAFSLSLNQDN